MAEYLSIESLIPKNICKLSYPLSEKGFNEIHHIKTVSSDKKYDFNEKMKMNIIGILVDGKFHKYDKPNCFFSEPMILPKDCEIKNYSYPFFTNSLIGDVYEPKLCTCDRNNPKTYLTEDNGTKAYKVEIIHDHLVKIYTYPKKIISSKIVCKSCMLSDFLVEYEPEKIFIGKSILNSMTEFSGGYGDEWNGNSILLFMGMHENKYKYIAIGDNIFSFCMKEKIIEYHSPVGNNEVPYPFCLTENYIYDFCHGLYHRNDIHDNGNEGIDFPYDLKGLNSLNGDTRTCVKELFPRTTTNYTYFYERKNYYITSK